MSLHYIYSDAPGSTIDITDRCRVQQVSVKTQAEEGAVALSSLVIDDPDGDFIPTGHRRLYIYEDEAPVDNQIIYNGFVANERVSRGRNRIGAGREWTLDLADPNVLLNRRVMNGTDANRPAETDLARMLALLTMTELNTVDDDTYVNLTAATTAMDAADYRGQMVGQYIDDCRQASGKNAFVYYNEATAEYGLWYDFATSDEYDSGCLLTTDEAQEVDGVTTFGYSRERTNLAIDPSRIASGVYLEYDGDPTGNGPTPHVYIQDADTIDNFAAIDMVAPSLNVKSTAKATARANRYLSDARTEAQIIHVVVTAIPRESVNAVKEGQLVQFKGEWVPGFEAYLTCRVLYRTVTEISEDPSASFEWEMDLDPIIVGCVAVVGNLHISDSGTIYAPSPPVSFQIDTPTEYPAQVVSFFLSSLTTTDIGDSLTMSSPWSIIDGYSPNLGGVPQRHIDIAIGHEPLASGDPDPCTVSWSGWTSMNGWEMLGFSIPTAATAPVQIASQILAGGVVTLPSPPTVGNLLVLMIVIGDPSGGNPATPPGWTRKALANLNPTAEPGLGRTGAMGIYTRCVGPGDDDTVEVIDHAFAHWAFVQEWALT